MQDARIVNTRIRVTRCKEHGGEAMKGKGKKKDSRKGSESGKKQRKAGYGEEPNHVKFLKFVPIRCTLIAEFMCGVQHTRH